MIPHQATFFNSKDIKHLKFNTKYKILADGELLSRMKLLEYYCCQYVDIFIAKFHLGGVSNNPKYLFKRIKEQWEMKSETQQKISYKWILFNLYNILGLCFYNIFGERLYYVFSKNNFAYCKE